MAKKKKTLLHILPFKWQLHFYDFAVAFAQFVCGFHSDHKFINKTIYRCHLACGFFSFVSDCGLNENYSNFHDTNDSVWRENRKIFIIQTI